MDELRHTGSFYLSKSSFGFVVLCKLICKYAREKSKNMTTIIPFLPGRWDVNTVPIDDVVRLALVMDEIAVMQPKLQILGVTIIVDLDGLNLSQVAQLTPTVAGQIVALMGVRILIKK